MPKTAIENKLYLLHPTRWQIYKIISENPGTYFYKLMSELPKYSDKVSSATIKVDGKRIYVPKNLRDLEAERAYMLLQNENARSIFLYVLNHDKPFQNEIARELNVHHDTIYYHTQRLMDAGLIESEKEGKFIRFKIGAVGNSLLEGSLNIISDEYVRFVLSQLADVCHFPELISKTNNSLVIRIVCPDQDDITLEIKLADYNFTSIPGAEGDMPVEE
jgi:DNA-binding transcriptional ArsR family regulator